MIDPMRLEDATEQVKELFEKYQNDILRKAGASTDSVFASVPTGDLWSAAASLTLATIILAKDK